MTDDDLVREIREGEIGEKMFWIVDEVDEVAIVGVLSIGASVWIE